jgi:hypothetical protein
MSQTTICEAIHRRNIMNSYYTGDGQPGFRTVEPHMVAYNKAGKLALSACFVSGTSESQTGQWWREYIIDDISALAVTSQQFDGPRPEFKRNGGKIYFNRHRQTEKVLGLRIALSYLPSEWRTGTNRRRSLHLNAR